MHGLRPEEVAAILELFEASGEVDRSHRKLAHRGSYIGRVPSMAELLPGPASMAGSREWPVWLGTAPEDAWRSATGLVLERGWLSCATSGTRGSAGASSHDTRKGLAARGHPPRRADVRNWPSVRRPRRRRHGRRRTARMPGQQPGFRSVDAMARTYARCSPTPRLKGMTRTGIRNDHLHGPGATLVPIRGQPRADHRGGPRPDARGTECPKRRSATPRFPP